MRYAVLFLALLLLAGCVEQQKAARAPAECDPPKMIVNGDCCVDSDYDGECDTTRAAPKPMAPAIAAPVAVAAPKTREILPLDEITCDYEAKTLSLLLRNTGDTSWELNNDLSWGHRGGIENIQAYFNQYQMNKKGGTYRDGKLLFGPGPRFANACGTPILSPGQETRCTFTDVPLAAPTFHNGTNELRLEIPNVPLDPRAEIICT